MALVGYKLAASRRHLVSVGRDRIWRRHSSQGYCFNRQRSSALNGPLTTRHTSQLQHTFTTARPGEPYTLDGQLLTAALVPVYTDWQCFSSHYHTYSTPHHKPATSNLLLTISPDHPPPPHPRHRNYSNSIV